MFRSRVEADSAISMTAADATVTPSIEPRRRLRRDIGIVGLLFTSVGSIIGSGWLFGALTAAKHAGPSALISWVIGGGAVILLALIHAELGGMYPVAGGSARFPHYAFGSLAGFAGGWFAFLGAVTTAPIEVEAALQYATNYVSGLTRLHAGMPVLTAWGYLIAAVLMLIFSAINVMGVKWLAETNKVAVWWKIAIPVIAVITLIITAFHPGNFSAGGGFMPFGWKGVFTAVASGGVIFAYLGFEQAIQMGGESRNPRRNIPLAVIGSMIIGVVLYILLQLAFLGALNPATLTHGWTHVAFGGNGALYGPFAGLATTLGIGWLATLLYVDAIISPGGTGLLYVGTSSRLSFALGRNRYIPRVFSVLSERGVPVLAIAFSFICGMIVFLPFPGWQQLVGFITSATVLAYGMAPLAMGALRLQEPGRDRPYRVPAGGVLAPVAFAIANELILFSGWAVVWKLLVAIAIGFGLLALSAATSRPSERPTIDWHAGQWLWPYLLGLGVISYLSSFDTKTPSSLLFLHGPVNALPFGVDVLVMAAFSLVIYLYAIRLRLPAERVRENVGDLTAEAEEEKAELRGGEPAPVI
jgi:amino acid transporter